MHQLNEITKSTNLKQQNCISGKIITADMCTRVFDIMEKLDSHIFDAITQLRSNEKQPYSEAVTRGVLCKKVFLKVSQNLQENTCARVSFLKKRLWHRCSPANFAKFLRTSFLQNISGDCFCKLEYNTDSLIKETAGTKY